MQRRTFIRNTSILLTGAVLPWSAYGVGEEQQESPLIYISPFKSDGDLSRCQAEVWYAQDGADMYVVTASNAWRARAVAQGLQRTQIWVGDVGQWQRSGGGYKNLPSLQATGSRVDDGQEHARLLEIFGAKYAAEWGSWGPRFRNGLADGTRVMLRYQPA